MGRTVYTCSWPGCQITPSKKHNVQRHIWLRHLRSKLPTSQLATSNTKPMIDRWLVACGAEGAIALAADNDDEYDGGVFLCEISLHHWSLWHNMMQCCFKFGVFGEYIYFEVFRVWDCLFDNLVVVCVNVCHLCGHRQLHDVHVWLSHSVPQLSTSPCPRCSPCRGLTANQQPENHRHSRLAASQTGTRAKATSGSRR
jgi:hypothetical protein